MPSGILNSETIDFVNKISCGDPFTIQMDPKGSVIFLIAFKTIDCRNCMGKKKRRLVCGLTPKFQQVLTGLHLFLQENAQPHG